MLRATWIIATLLLTGVSACSHVEYRRAVVDVPDVEKAIAVAKELDSRKTEPPPVGTKWFEIRRGAVPAIVTAPHSTQPFREGKYRFADGGGTAGLAVALHEICNVTVVYTTYASPSDPNFYDDNEFKGRLGELISEVKPALLLDIHASHAYRPYEVDIGTMYGRSVLGDRLLVPSLIDVFRKEGLANISVDYFPASKNMTVTKYASSRGIPSAQLEFSATRTTPGTDDLFAHRFAQSIQALTEFLGSRGLCARINSNSIKN